MTESTNDRMPLQKLLNLRLNEEGTLQWLTDKAMSFRRLMAYYTCAMMEIETKFKVLNEEFSLLHDRNPIESIKTRLKRFDSIAEKMQRCGQPLTVEAIEATLNDIAGVRVICAFPDDVYLLSEALLKQDDIKLVKRKDYIAEPKENGYRSLHLIVEVPIFLAQEKRMMKVEIQLRTIAMDFWASLEHQLRYKKEIPAAEGLMLELKECAQVSAQLDQRMNAVRTGLEYLQKPKE